MSYHVCTFVQLIPQYKNGNGLFCSCCLSFQLNADFSSFYNPIPPLDPRCHLDIVYICYGNTMASGRHGSEGEIYLKLNLITQYLAYEGQTCACAVSSV